MKLHLHLHPASQTVSSPGFPAAFQAGSLLHRPLRFSRPKAVAYMAFFVMVFACMAAAAAMVGSDVPLVVGAL